MTDPNDLERAERIRRLQERRAASARTANRAVATTTTGNTDSPAPLRTSSTSGHTPKRARRRHPAAATRWLLGGLSVASFLAIGGTVAAANQANMTTATNQANVSTAQPAGNAATATPAAQPATAATPASSATQKATAGSTTPRVAHTTTRGS